MIIAVVLNIVAFTMYSGSFIDWFTGFSNILNSVLTMVFALVMIAFLLYEKSKILKRFKDIDDEEVLEELKDIIEGCNHKTIHATMMNVYILYRRIFMAVVLIFLRDYPSLQVTCLMISAVLNFIYVVVVLPYEESNFSEILNEFAILLCAYLMNTFL